MSLDFKQTLESLGYKLRDRGKYWQTNAQFRDGNNFTAIQIFKDNGNWNDYVEGKTSLKFDLLVKKTLGTNNQSVIQKYIKHRELDSFGEPENKGEKITMDEIFDKEYLKKLMPHYAFYNKKGISDKTLKFFMGGFAHSGKLNKRFVFPIFNQDSLIHGFAGRDMTSIEERPKWKHVGRKSSWIYPAFIGDIQEIICEKNQAILVESIGDMLALHEQGIKNVLVTFGLDVSPSLICYMTGIGINKITISFNNDAGKKYNRGLDSCIKTYLKLLKHFDPSVLEICLPIKNDFGDMDQEDFSTWTEKLNSIDSQKQKDYIIKVSKTLFKKGFITNNLMKNIKYINE
jgi:hypothetical protein